MKTRYKHFVLLFLITSAVILFYGCDAYSLTDQFYPVPDLSLSTQSPSLSVLTSTSVYTSGGVQPYAFAVRSSDLYNQGESLGQVVDGSFTAGDSVGCVEILLSDSSGKEVSAYISVLPPAPQNFTLTSPKQNRVELNWIPPHWKYITGILIYRSENGGPFVEYQMTGNSDTGFIDTGVSANNSYAYKLYSVARTSREYKSLPTTVLTHN